MLKSMSTLAGVVGVNGKLATGLNWAQAKHGGG
jgi:hypothetical protein